MSKHDPTRLDKINEWKEKGLEWVCDRLWNAHLQNQRLRNELQIARHNYGDVQAEIAIAHSIKSINYNLATVLSNNGIKPTRLRLTYMTCAAMEHDECNGDCDECCNYQREVSTYSFYDYKITPNKYGFEYLIEGITSTLETMSMIVDKVVVEDTNEVLYLRDEGSDDDV